MARLVVILQRVDKAGKVRQELKYKADRPQTYFPPPGIPMHLPCGHVIVSGEGLPVIWLGGGPDGHAWGLEVAWELRVRCCEWRRTVAAYDDCPGWDLMARGDETRQVRNNRWDLQ